jgi:uncharacterized repeat protein (TIGR01451 family)
MRRILMTLATAVTMALLASGVAVADTVTTTFEPPAYQPGTVNGQGGEFPWPGDVHCAGPPAPAGCWKSAVPGNIPSLPNGYDQEVVTNAGAPGAFGLQSLRISNAFNPAPDTFPPEYHYQTYSKPTTDAASEDGTTTEYTAEFSFISVHPDRQQPRLRIDLSPDNGEGGRMSYIGLFDTADTEDTDDGINVIFFDTPEPDGEFVGYDLGTLRRDIVHKIKFWMKLNPGPDNDLVRILIDGHDVGQCFTTWENFYRRLSRPVPISDRLLFRSTGAQEIESLIDGGYLFDSVMTTTANGPGPADCSGGGEGPPDGIVIDKTTRTRSALPGQLITYRITVRNRGDAPVRGLRACDRPPRALRFVRATRPLDRAAGRRLCLTIRLLRPGQRMAFDATFRLDRLVTADTITNGSSVVTPTASAPSPEPPDGPADVTRHRRLDRDPARIRVRAAPQACPATLNPRARAAC